MSSGSPASSETAPSTFKARALALLASGLLSLALLECGARGLDGEWRGVNFLSSDAFMLGEASPAAHDPDLGWVPRPGSRTEYRGDTVTITEDGLRSLGSQPPKTGPIDVLAVGDSYTFGSEVGDDEAWPARLAYRIDARIFNAGVFNYGIDQIVLRAEQWLARLEPDVLIASFIPSDILRSELRMRGHAPKPWFELEEGRLQLQGTPVPEPQSLEERLGPVRWSLGHSYFVHRLMLGVAPRPWVLGAGPDQRAHRNGVAVSCSLLHRLAAGAERRGTRLVLLGQAVDAPKRFERRALMELLWPCISPLADRGVLLLDLHPILEELRASKPRAHARLFDGHMTAGGNAWVAARLAELLEEHGWAEPRNHP